jgi:hypothetical protein
VPTVDVVSAFPDHKAERWYYELWKPSHSGEAFERKYTTWDYLTELDMDSFYYRVYYHQ